MTVRNRVLNSLLASSAVFIALRVFAAPDMPIPQLDGYSHLGVVTCAGSTCHGAAAPFENSPVRQDEFIVWHEQDKHAKAYEVLLNEQSRIIAGNLGLGSAHTADVCLDCHADNIPEDKRGKRFKIEEGVSCEACHGGSEKWLGPHIAGVNSNAENVELGLYPTGDSVARGKLCLSCHFGGDNKFVTHGILGAGHPRMRFELDSYTNAQPAHFDVDADYRERKTDARFGASAWVLGQLYQAELFLDAFLDPGKHSGLFPELVFFDCHACHHPMSDLRWTPRAATGLDPGVVRLNDANLQMLEHIAALVSPDDVVGVRDAIRGLHQATGESMDAARTAAGEMRALIRRLSEKAGARDYDADDANAVITAITTRGANGEFPDYSLAEQSAMAVSALAATLEVSGALTGDDRQRIGDAIDGLYRVLEEEQQFEPMAYRAAMQSVSAALAQ